MVIIPAILTSQPPCAPVLAAHGSHARRVALHMAGCAVVGFVSGLHLTSAAIDADQPKCAFMEGAGDPMARMQTALAGWITDEIWQPSFLSSQFLTVSEKNDVVGPLHAFISLQAPSLGLPSDRSEREHFGTHWRRTTNDLTEDSGWAAVVIVANALMGKGKIDSASVKSIVDERKVSPKPIDGLLQARERVKDRADAAYKIFTT